MAVPIEIVFTQSHVTMETRMRPILRHRSQPMLDRIEMKEKRFLTPFFLQISLLSGVEATRLLEVIGYAGNGQLDVADATMSGPVISQRFIPDSSHVALSLDTAFVESIMNGGFDLGLLLMPPTSGNQVGFFCSEASYADLVPTLTIDYIVPEPAFQLGDMNASNGATEPNGNDIHPFVMALVNRPVYEAVYPGLDADARGDINGSGSLDGNDINPFVQLLVGSSQPIPEPASALVLLVGLAGLVRRRLRR